MLRDLHTIGIERGDLDRDNFTIIEATQKAHLIDFEHVTNLRDDKVERESACPPIELTEDTGRGSVSIL